jgi:acid phosphatase family membrane protein YuiD
LARIGSQAGKLKNLAAIACFIMTIVLIDKKRLRQTKGDAH